MWPLSTSAAIVHADINFDTHCRRRVPQFLSRGPYNLRPGYDFAYESHRGWPTRVTTTVTWITTDILDRLPRKPII